MGFRVQNTRGQEILLRLLYNKATGRPSDDRIAECNLYGEKEPWEIWDQKFGNGKNQKDHLLVFTKLKKKTANGSRFDRTVGTGSWKGEDNGVKIYCNDMSAGTTTLLVGIRKRFHYEGRSSSVDDRRWIMYEYSLDASMPVHADFQNYVVCRIINADDSENKRKSRKRESAEMKGEHGDQILEPEHICNKTKEGRLLTTFQQENKQQLELTCNDNNVTYIAVAKAIATNPNEVAAIDTKCHQHGDDRIIIELSDNDENPTNEVAQVKNIGTTVVAEQLNSVELLMGTSSCNELIGTRGVNEVLDPINGVNDHIDDLMDIESLVEDLTKDQAQLMKEPEIEMLPNMLFLENWKNGCELLYM